MSARGSRTRSGLSPGLHNVPRLPLQPLDYLLQRYSCRHILIRGSRQAVSSEWYERAPANTSRCFSRPSGSIMHPSDDGLVSSFLSALLHGATATLHSVVGTMSRRR
jgi:hypothetical protein